MTLQCTRGKTNFLNQTLDESMDPILEIPSRIQDPRLKPLQPLYVDSWVSLHVKITIYVPLAENPADPLTPSDIDWDALYEVQNSIFWGNMA